MRFLVIYRIVVSCQVDINLMVFFSNAIITPYKQSRLLTSSKIKDRKCTGTVNLIKIYIIVECCGKSLIKVYRNLLLSLVDLIRTNR